MNLYLHFPFCQQKCFYCDFISLSNQEHLIDEYCQNLIKEIEIYGKKFEHIGIDTIYLGGGTPSIVDSKNLEKIIKAIRENFQVNEKAEITIEANPDSLSKEKLKKYLEIGINRLSIGVQAWQNDLLKLIGRTYKIEVFTQAYKWAREVGFKNINLDLIFALPTQTKKQWQESLTQIIALDPEHIACYSLEWDNNSIFGNQQRNNKIKKATDNLDRQMYRLACKYLEKAGYHQYEISNFSKKGFVCQHNADFWKSKNYLGLGVAAISKIDNKTWQNQKNIKLYCQKLEQNQLAIEKVETINKKDQLASSISLALRTNEGIDKKILKTKNLQNLIDIKLIKENKEKIHLTTKGKDLLNYILLELKIF
jgi:oxygen-independent coproporphyrinogen-3 oxidase